MSVKELENTGDIDNTTKRYFNEYTEISKAGFEGTYEDYLVYRESYGIVSDGTLAGARVTDIRADLGVGVGVASSNLRVDTESRSQIDTGHRSGKSTEANRTLLPWIYNRMIEVHKENANYDYMQKFKEIIDTI